MVMGRTEGDARLLAIIALALGSSRSPPMTRSRRSVTRGSARPMLRSSSTTVERGEGPPVLLIHGFGTNTYTWRHIAPDLARDHKVIAVDLKGFGQLGQAVRRALLCVRPGRASRPAHPGPRSPQPHHRRALLRRRHRAPARARGRSTRLNGRIAKLVLLDTIAYPQHIPVFFKPARRAACVSQLGVRMVPPSVQTRMALRIAYFDDSKIDPDEIETYAEPIKTAAGKHAMIHSARQIMPDDRGADRRALYDDRAADADPVVRPRPHRAARDRPQARAHDAQLQLAASSTDVGTCRRRSSRRRPCCEIRHIPGHTARLISFLITLIGKSDLPLWCSALNCAPCAMKAIKSPIGEKHGRKD